MASTEPTPTFSHNVTEGLAVDQLPGMAPDNAVVPPSFLLGSRSRWGKLEEADQKFQNSSAHEPRHLQGGETYHADFLASILLKLTRNGLRV